VVLLKKEEKKNNKEKENPTHSVSDGGSWTLGSTKVPGKRGKKMREELTKGKVRRKYTSERKYVFLLKWSDYPWHGIDI